MAKEVTASPVNKRASRWGLLALGGFLLFWLPIEDTSLMGVQILALALCFLAGTHYSKEIAARNELVPMALYGLAIGGLAVPITILLMIVKNGLHGHAIPDYSYLDIRHIFQQLPYWGLAGALIGFGAHQWSRRRV